MRKIDYIKLASILNQDIKDSLENQDYHLLKALNATNNIDTDSHTKQVRYYEFRESHTKDLCSKIARNLSVDTSEFLTLCGIK